MVAVDPAGQSVAFPIMGLTSEEFRWEPERADGGEVMIELATGELTYRPHRWRLRWTPHWGAMDASVAKNLLRAVNILGQGGRMFVQPHQDAPYVYEMIIDPDSLATGYTGGRYLGMDITIEFISKTLIRAIPVWTTEEAVPKFRRVVV